MRSAVFLLLAFICLSQAHPTTVKQLNFKNLYAKPSQIVPARPAPRIIGGHEAEPHSIPYQVFLTVSGPDGGWYCGGSLISTTVVLTAGHCGDGGTSADIVLGAHKPLITEDTQVRVTSRNIRVHQEFDINEIKNDIAIIILPSAVVLDDNINLVTLPANDDDQYETGRATVSGWGLTDGFGSSLSDVLNEVQLNILPNRECGEYFSEVLDTNICTSGDEETGSCNGDSGGPLTVNGTQVGIVSFGIIFCLEGYPSAYTRVSKYLEWIDENSL